jgi:hypothetical protein
MAVPKMIRVSKDKIIFFIVVLFYHKAKKYSRFYSKAILSF